MTRWIPMTLGLAVLGTLLAGCPGGQDREADVHHEEPATDAPDGRGGARLRRDAHDEHGEDDGVVELDPRAVARVGLVTAPAALRTLGSRRTTTGKVGFDENRLAHVASRVSGRLVRVPAELGARVAAGEALAVLDSMELGEAKAAYLRIRARREVVDRRFERERSLHADRIASEQDVLEAEAAAREAAADLAAAREALRLLGLPEAEIEGLSWDAPQPSYVAVRSHFAGKVVAREATLGELVTPERVLFTVADLSRVWVWIDVYERDLPHVRLGERVEVRLDAWPDETLTGELAYVADQLDPASRTVRARVDLSNTDGRFKPGMFARVTLSDPGEDAAPPVLAVPRAAVQRQAWLGAPPAQREEAVVFVRTGPTSFERREVELGQVTDELAEVVFGLEAGEEVVTKGAFLLKSQASSDQLGGHHH